jgi:hypothetical protein
LNRATQRFFTVDLEIAILKVVEYPHLLLNHFDVDQLILSHHDSKFAGLSLSLLAILDYVRAA